VILEFVLDRIRVMQASSFEKFLEMIFGWPSLSLDVALGGHHALLIGVTGLLIAATATGCYSDVMGLLLQHLLVTINTFSSALGGDLCGCSSAAPSRHPRAAWDEGGPNHLFARSMSRCDVEQLHGSLLLFVAELMNQGAARCAIPKCRGNIGIGHTRKLVEFL
jgi:hypothetical protein